MAFLEADFNKNNKYSVLAKSQDQSVQVQEMLQNLSAHIPKLDKMMNDIEQVGRFMKRGNFWKFWRQRETGKKETEREREIHKCRYLHMTKVRTRVCDLEAYSFSSGFAEQRHVRGAAECL